MNTSAKCLDDASLAADLSMVTFTELEAALRGPQAASARQVLMGSLEVLERTLHRRAHTHLRPWEYELCVAATEAVEAARTVLALSSDADQDRKTVPGDRAAHASNF